MIELGQTRTTGHAGGTSTRDAAGVPAGGEATEPPPGFGHFAIGNPLAPRFSVGGLDPRGSPAARRLLEDITFRLHSRMASNGIDWPPAGPNPNADTEFAGASPPSPADNPFVPSGYSYLLQLIGQDMVGPAAPFSTGADRAANTAHQRRNRLRLDALYGDGPRLLPGHQMPDSEPKFGRSALRLGRGGQLAGQPAGRRYCDPARSPLADPYGGDHAILSQLATVFLVLHGIFLDRYHVAADSADRAQDSTAGWLCAREATTLVYRHIIRNDVMRRILHPLVYSYYNARGARYLDPHIGEPGSAMPLEFSHGAFRFVHVMERDAYQMDDGPGRHPTLPRGPVAASDRPAPITGAMGNRLVEWSNFFVMPGLSHPATLNLSQRIGPAVPLPQVAAPMDQRMGRMRAAGVLYHDLLEAGLGELWSVNALIDAVTASAPHVGIVAASLLLSASPAQRYDAIHTWLTAEMAPWHGAAGEAALDALAEDPPLPFFVLFEAMQDPAALGCRLGALGSILVAETIFGELDRNKLAAEQVAYGLAAQLAGVCNRFTDPAFATMTTMSDAIDFIWASLRR